MTNARRLTLVVVTALLLCAVGYGAGFALRSSGPGSADAAAAPGTSAPPTQRPTHAGADAGGHADAEAGGRRPS